MRDCNCGHPAGHHDAGACWTNTDGTESFENTCGCWNYEPTRTKRQEVAR